MRYFIQQQMGACSSQVKPHIPQHQQPVQESKRPQQPKNVSETESQAVNIKIPWAFITQINHIRGTHQQDLGNGQLEIEQPDLHCRYENKAVYICLFKGCLQSNNCLRCAKKDCPTCIKDHQYHGNKFHLQELTKQLKLRALELKKVMNKMQEIQARLIDDIVTRKLSDFNKFNVAGLDQNYARVINAIYVTHDNSQIKGALLNDITDMLGDINHKLSLYGAQLLEQFSKEADNLALRWQNLQKNIIQRLMSYPKIKPKNTQRDSKLLQNMMSGVQQLGNPHNSLFKILQENRVRIAYVGQDQKWCNFIKQGAISRVNRSKLTVTLEKTVDSALMVGVGTKKIFGMNNAYRGEQAVLYRCGNGYLYKMGDGSKKNRRVMQGQTIMLDVDLSHNEIQWWCGGQKLVSTSLPPQLSSSELHFVVLFYNKNDQISVLCD